MALENKTNKKQIVFLILVLVLFLVPTVIGFIVYAFPKFLISKYALKNKEAKSRIIRDTIIFGLIVGVISTFGKYSALKERQSNGDQTTTEVR